MRDLRFSTMVKAKVERKVRHLSRLTKGEMPKIFGGSHQMPHPTARIFSTWLYKVRGDKYYPLQESGNTLAQGTEEICAYWRDSMAGTEGD